MSGPGVSQFFILDVCHWEHTLKGFWYTSASSQTSLLYFLFSSCMTDVIIYSLFASHFVVFWRFNFISPSFSLHGKRQSLSLHRFGPHNHSNTELRTYKHTVLIITSDSCLSLVFPPLFSCSRLVIRSVPPCFFGVLCLSRAKISINTSLTCKQRENCFLFPL